MLTTDKDIAAHTRFESIADFLTGVQYILSLDRVASDDTIRYAHLAAFYAAYLNNELTNLEPFVMLTEQLIERYGLTADPATEPVRALLQMYGWQSPADLINAAKALIPAGLSTSTKLDVVTIREITTLVKEAEMLRAQSKPVTFSIVKRLTDVYEQALFVLLAPKHDEEVNVDVSAVNKV